MHNAEIAQKVEEMKKMWQSGANKAQIANTFGCTKQYVYYLLKREGLTFEDRFKPKKNLENEWVSKLSKNFGKLMLYYRTNTYKFSKKQMAEKLGITIYKLNQLEEGSLELTLKFWLDCVDKLGAKPEKVIKFLREDNPFDGLNIK